MAAMTALTTIMVSAPALAQVVGQPVDKALGLQPAATKIRADQIAFHDHLLLPVIIGISTLVLVLLIIVMIRFNRRANPTPARWSHNTPVEILWTVGPVLILMVVSIFSFRLLFEEHDMGKADMTVKVTGRQWNWDYEYPDQKIAAYTSTLMTAADTKAKDLPYQLATNAPMIVPVNKTVRVQVTAEDVIHSFSVPAFGIKIDAIPGRLNETWFKATRIGVYYGQCSQLCGVDHSFMPIEVHVVSQADFDTWVASKQPKPTVVAAATPATEAHRPTVARTAPMSTLV